MSDLTLEEVRRRYRANKKLTRASHAQWNHFPRVQAVDALRNKRLGRIISAMHKAKDADARAEVAAKARVHPGDVLSRDEAGVALGYATGGGSMGRLKRAVDAGLIREFRVPYRTKYRCYYINDDIETLTNDAKG